MALHENRHATKTLKAIFSKPVASNIKFSEIATLVIAWGGKVREGDASRVAFLLASGVMHAHRPPSGAPVILCAGSGESYRRQRRAWLKPIALHDIRSESADLNSTPAFAIINRASNQPPSVRCKKPVISAVEISANSG